MRANLPDKNWFLGKPLPGRPDLVLTEFKKSGNDGHLFRAYSNDLRRDFACKIIPRSNLVGANEPSPRWRAEIEKANALRNPAVVRFVDLQEWIDTPNKIDCVAFVSEYVYGDNLGDFIKKNRCEITIPYIINYLHADAEPKLAFIEDVFRKRLSAPGTGFPVKELQELLGSNAEQNFNEDARQLRDGKKPELWGKETLGRLCSGDIHYLISLVRDMVSLAGEAEMIARQQISPRVAPRLQNRAVREAAGTFLKNLRSIPKHGDQLVAIVTAFGNVAHSFLKYRSSKNETGNPPHQASRIEPYEPFTLSEQAQRLYDELLRYSVFIEDFRGKSRRGKVVPRLYLRRFLIPHFNLTFSTRDSIELEPAEFERFLVEPSKFEDMTRRRGPDEAESQTTQPQDEHPRLPFDSENRTN